MTTTPTEPLDPVDQLERLLTDAAVLLGTVRSERAAQAGILEAERAAHVETRARLAEALDRIEDLEHPDPVAPAFEIGAAYLSNTDPTPLEQRLGVRLDARRTYENNDNGAERQISDTVAVVKANIAAGRKRSSVSAKVPVSMASAAAGGADDWAKRFALALSEAIKGTGHKTRMALNHEPENDVAIQRSSGSVTNGTQLVAYRDNWKATQDRLAPLFDLPGIDYIVILMGDHQWNSGANYYPWWQMDKAIPSSPAIKGVGFDYYERFGQNGSVKWTSWAWLDRAKAWFAAHPQYVWGLSETAWTEAAEKAKPGQAQIMVDRLKAAGGLWLEYFDTNLNSAAAWLMEPGSAREKSFAQALKTR